ncbi:condensin-2 complex subunit CAP-D3 [Primulina huaijiensis]|uniref:condensin-2 complex subunit CAP-D3 n=1 Tax=Primulina huaijiensis TaxID=1492673 RepID=UPI003CC77AD8
MDEIIGRILSDLENPSPISQAFLKDLEALLGYALGTNDSMDLENLYSELSSRNIGLTSLTNAIYSAMDSGGSPRISVLASKVYVSLLLAPNSPVLSLFTPIAFLSLLRTIRMAFKDSSLVSNEGSLSRNPGAKKKGRRNARLDKSRAENRDMGCENEGEEKGYNVKDLFFVLDKFEVVLGLVHLDRFPDCLKALVQTVCQILTMAVEFSGHLESFGSLNGVCSRILGEVLKAVHGNQVHTAAEVLKELSSLILLHKSEIRSFGLGFVVNRMVELGESSSDIKKAVANLPKYLAQKAPEKAEPRALAVESIIEIVKALDFEDQVGFADYVVKMSQGKGQFRLLSVDIIPVLMMSLSGSLGFDMVNGVENSWGWRLLEALVQRCSDITAGIRARALNNLAQLVVPLSRNDNSKEALKEVLGLGNKGTNGMNDLLKKRCMDEKAAVRKASLLLISKLAALLGGELDGDLLKTIGMACSDPLVSIRKVAISAISEAFRTYSTCLIIKEWMHSVPRLINDNETSIQEECENLFLELVLERVVRAGSKRSSNHESVPHDTLGQKNNFDMDSEFLFPQGVLGLLKGICDGEVAPWVKKICSSLGKKKKLRPSICIALKKIIRESEIQWLNNSMPIEKWTAPPGSWFLLSEVSAYLPKAVDWEFLHRHLQHLDKYKPVGELKGSLEQGDPDEGMLDIEFHSVAWIGDRVFLLQTISNVSVELPPEPAADLAHSFLKRLEGFNMHSTEVNAHVKALRTLCKRKALNTDEADLLVTRWTDQLLSKSSKVLDSYMSKISDVTKENVFLTPHTGVSQPGSKTAAYESKLSTQATIAMYTIGSLVIVCPSANFKSIVPVIHTIITSGISDSKSSKLPGSAAPVKDRAPSLFIQAWLTMGKICLADSKLAKRYLPLFVQELEKSDSAALRNNIVVVMSDFCVRYTALVDCYMSKITKCLRDPCELVRRQTFTLLSRLLQRDYVKWRGVLFLRFLLCLVDDSEKIRQQADFLFGNILKAKAPLLAYNSFVEAIFVLNDCNAHTGCKNANSSRNENRLFTLRGNDEKSRSQRMHIYVTLLKQMAPEHLLATFAKVCAEILASATDTLLSLEDSTGLSVLQDAFLILSSKEIRVQPSRGSSSEAADIEEEVVESGVASTSAAKGRAITQAVRKGLIQNTIPIFIELKRLLESKNSPLTGSLMECLRILLKDYKNEIDDILVADRQLQKELIYDMQKYESMKSKSTAVKAVASVQKSDTHRSTGVSKEPSLSALKSKLPEQLHTNSKVASAAADAIAAATVRSVLREVNQGASTPLSTMNVPKLKAHSGEAAAVKDGRFEVIESLRRRQSFYSDDEN